jgi:hypothetical protein
MLRSVHVIVAEISREAGARMQPRACPELAEGAQALGKQKVRTSPEGAKGT